MTTPGTVGKCKIDNHADTCCLGSNFIPLYFTGETCDVTPYLDEYEPAKDIPICTGATAYWDIETGGTTILIIHQALWFGDKLKHSLINPNQIRANGFGLSNDPFDVTQDFGIELEGDKLLPFVVDRTIVNFETYAPTNDKLMAYRQVELTSEAT